MKQRNKFVIIGTVLAGVVLAFALFGSVAHVAHVAAPEATVNSVEHWEYTLFNMHEFVMSQGGFAAPTVIAELDRLGGEGWQFAGSYQAYWIFESSAERWVYTLFNYHEFGMSQGGFGTPDIWDTVTAELNRLGSEGWQFADAYGTHWIFKSSVGSAERWEYTLFNVREFGMSQGGFGTPDIWDTVLAELNRLGNEGWRFAGTYHTHLIFKNSAERWEYTWFDPRMNQEELNRLGSEGWQFAGIGTDVQHLISKRSAGSAERWEQKWLNPYDFSLDAFIAELNRLGSEGWRFVDGGFTMSFPRSMAFKRRLP